MKGVLVALGQLDGRPAAARDVDGMLDDLIVDPPPGAAPLPETIMLATADRPLKGTGGFILKSPFGSAFLRNAKGVRQGELLPVQVTGYAEPGKAVPVTARILFKSRAAIVTPAAPGVNVSRRIRENETRQILLDVAGRCFDGSAGAGLILRSAAADIPLDDVARDVEATAALASRVLAEAEGATRPGVLLEGPDAHALARREWADARRIDEDEGAFERHELPQRIEALLQSRHELPGGAFAFIEPTRALVAVDVNTGSDLSPAAGLKANLALSKDLPRLLRCRGLGGQITIDFAPMPKKDRRMVEQRLKAAFAADPVETTAVGWTPLGHYELQRKRERFPLNRWTES